MSVGGSHNMQHAASSQDRTWSPAARDDFITVAAQIEPR
jgi:hypothetical protein